MGNVKFTEKYTLRVSDYTCYDRLAPHGILDLMQDIAGKHANTFQMSYEDLKEKNLIWVLLRVKYKVINEAGLYCKSKVVTWPKHKGLVDFERQSQIYDDESGLLLVNASSKWVVLDATTRKIIPAKHINYTATPCDEDLFEGERFDRLKDFDISSCNSYTYKTAFLDLDHNGHVNNIRYCVMILNAIRLNKDELVDSFQIDFINETLLDDELTLYYYKEDNVYHIKAICNDKIVFISKMCTK